MAKSPKKLRVAMVVGARPNFVKAAPLWHAMKGNLKFRPCLIHTGQHYNQGMSKVFFDQFGLPTPDLHLYQKGKSPSQQIAEIILALENEFNKHFQDLVIVFGDVNSTLAAAISANKLGIPIAHVEAGLRSFDRSMPEEHNRIVSDQLADFLFTPSIDANKNLLREGIPGERIYLVGNIMVDSLKTFRNRAKKINKHRHFGLEKGEYVLATLHRPANVDQTESIKDIFTGLKRISKILPVLFSVHPRAEKAVKKLIGKDPSNAGRLVISEPFNYLDFMSLMMDAKAVITDSGGVQEETTVLGVPCLTVRENTERPITLSQGTNQLVGTTATGIEEGFLLLGRKSTPKKLPLLWDGRTSRRILNVLSQKL